MTIQLWSNINRRDGIALVVVLGFLSILTMMAVALLTLTRTERLVADSALELSRCRQLARSALNAAMNDYDHALWDSNLIIPSLTESVLMSRHVGSVPNQAVPLGNLKLLEGEVVNWIPKKYFPPTMPQLNARVLLTNGLPPFNLPAQWVYVVDPESPRRILGRYGYVVLDCSGAMDANLISMPNAGGLFNPSSERQNVRDVDMSSLPEAVALVNFIQNRNWYHGFDSFPELITFNDGEGNGPNWQNPDLIALDTNKLSNLMPYSLNYYRGWFDWGSGSWQAFGWEDVNPDVNKWTAAQAKKIFSSPDFWGMDASVADMMADSLMDFRDTNRIPINVNSFSTEAVPMINEIIYKGTLTTASDGLTANLVVNLTIETWYPFPGKPALGGYRFKPNNPRLGIGPLGSGEISFTFQNMTQGTIANVGLISPSEDIMFTEDYSDGKPQKWDYTYTANGLPISANDSLRLLVRVNLLELIRNADTADSVSALVFLPFSFTAAAANGTVSLAEKGLEVNDPRMNYEVTAWTAASPVSPGLINPSVAASGGDDEGYSLYVRDANLESPADFGFISIGQPWKTINLFEPAGIELLNRFCGNQQTNIMAKVLAPQGIVNGFWTNGLVHPGTLNSNVLRSIFQNASIAEAPVPDDTNVLNGASEPLDFLIDQIVTGSHEGREGLDSFDSPASWAGVSVMQVGGAMSGGAQSLNNNQRDALVRNTYRAFNPTENLFTVVVVAQAIKDNEPIGDWDADLDVISAERRAVALVWRDPFPNGDDIHEMFVRQFRYLDE
ncbi:MAG TPA: hypothetical protein DCZ95_12730 [Verrucomicrobia bacterium]|nr:MAG: hypothetical protein A2X46_11935 [Lentisphaerae bacterium GWF2_57_35]HBA84952.1 hypothetical protein [Verrucomicrobiota bacterium]